MKDEQKRPREDVNNRRKHHNVNDKIVNDVAQEFICPITKELPLEPVYAEDGHIYERSAIEEVITIQRQKRQRRQQQEDNTPAVYEVSNDNNNDSSPSTSSSLVIRSPVTNEYIGTRLFPAKQVRNAIEKIVRSGNNIDDGIFDCWKIHISEEKDVLRHRRLAANGDTEAMFTIGTWYTYGSKGLPRDWSKAYYWYQKAADSGHIKGMACAGDFLVNGFGVTKDELQGVALLMQSAQGGSDIGAYIIGIAYLNGTHGLSKNLLTAKFWLQKVVDGDCVFVHLKDSFLEKAKFKLRSMHMGNW